MIYIFFVPLLALTILFFVLVRAIKNKNKRLSAFNFGKSEFDIELPENTDAFGSLSEYRLPSLLSCSDAESFMVLIIPYLGSLPLEKREKIHKEMEALSTDLKMNKEIYRAFMDEYEKYEGLSDEQALNKWRKKN